MLCVALSLVSEHLRVGAIQGSVSEQKKGLRTGQVGLFPLFRWYQRHRTRRELSLRRGLGGALTNIVHPSRPFGPVFESMDALLFLPQAVRMTQSD